MKFMMSRLSTGMLVLALLALACSKKPEAECIQTSDELITRFTDPPSEYRSVPFWVWNDKISEEGIDFQMKEFKKAGVGGLFVHPRPGLITEYLSEEWFHLFDYTVQKGKELGLKVWIYDENSYPSGFAGGHVPAEMPDSYKHGTGLVLSVQHQLNISLSDTIAFVLKQTDKGFVDVTGSVEQENGLHGTYYIYRKGYPPKSPWYGGWSYVDLLHKGVTEKFIEITMSRGYERNKADFGKAVPGIFTDEPNVEAALPEGASLRWTPDLMDVFQKRWGYDLTVHLPSINEETGNWKKVRHDYYETLLELFVDRYAKPWNKYCSEKGLIWTGHFWEHGWPRPTHGFDESACYVYQQMPGIDMLAFDTAGFTNHFRHIRAVRELRSAANQSGSIRTLCEAYGGGGWEMSFETQKKLADWQAVFGVNFFNQHLSYYSLNGVRKFDYPLSFSFHEPWWDSYKLMGDYLGRLSMAMSSGKQINQTVMLQPNSTAWMYYSRRMDSKVFDSIKSDFKNLVIRFEELHIEYDLGSENVLKNMGSVTPNALKIGKCSYNLVVIPAEMQNIDQLTFDQLKNYLKIGGKILSFKKISQFVDGIETSKVDELAAKYPKQWFVASDVNDPMALKLLRHDDFTLENRSDNTMFYHQRRILNDGQLLFFVNTHESKMATAKCTVAGKQITKLDLVTGKKYWCPSKTENGKLSFEVELVPVGSALYLVTNKNTNAPQYEISGKESVIEHESKIEIKNESANVLAINYLDLKTAKTEKKEVYFMNALIGLYNENGIKMGNPWQHKIQYKNNWLKLDTLFNVNSWFEASYHFQVNSSLDAQSMKSIRAVVERPDLWQVSINGHNIAKSANTWWIDQQFPHYEIGNYLNPGQNTLTLKAPRMHILAELMPVYILGDFLVKPTKTGFEITGGSINSFGSWRESGLPFYSQKVAYSQSFSLKKSAKSSYKVRLNRWNGTIAEVFVNGRPAGLIPWKPYEVDVTQWMKDGRNDIVVKVVGSLRNTFGFFYPMGRKDLYGPTAWNNAPEKIPLASEYFLIDYGLMEPFELVELK